MGDKARQGETRGDRGRQLGKADAPSNTGTHVGRQWETREDKGRQDLGKADTESNAKADTLRKHFTTVDPRQGADSRSDLRNGVT